MMGHLPWNYAGSLNLVALALGANILGFMSAQAIDLGQIRESATPMPGR